MLQTRNSLPENVRAKVVEVLQESLYDSIDLLLSSKQAHWNVRGPDFYELHKLFDKVHDVVESGMDSIAERIGQLGAISEGTSRAVANSSSLTEYPLHAIEEIEHVEALSSSMAMLGEILREGIDRTNDLGDAVSADILVQFARKLDKVLWFVENHLYGKQQRTPATRLSRNSVEATTSAHQPQ